MKKGIVLAVALVLLLMPVTLWAQGARALEMVHKEAAELDDKQLAKLEELRLEHQMAKIKLDAQLEILHLEMKQELSKDDPSKKALGGFISKIGAVKEKLHKNRIDHLLELKKILEPGQWKHIVQCCGDMSDCSIMVMKGDGMGCCSMGGHACMMKGQGGKGCRGSGCCPMGCCSMGGHACMMKGQGGMGGHGKMAGTIHKMTGSYYPGGAHKTVGSGCPGKKMKMEGCPMEKNVEKKIERRCIKTPSKE